MKNGLAVWSAMLVLPLDKVSILYYVLIMSNVSTNQAAHMMPSMMMGMMMREMSSQRRRYWDMR